MLENSPKRYSETIISGTKNWAVIGVLDYLWFINPNSEWLEQFFLLLLDVTSKSSLYPTLIMGFFLKNFFKNYCKQEKKQMPVKKSKIDRIAVGKQMDLDEVSCAFIPWPLFISNKILLMTLQFKI